MTIVGSSRVSLVCSRFANASRGRKGSGEGATFEEHSLRQVFSDR
jgi:hypothetical protein